MINRKKGSTLLSAMVLMSIVICFTTLLIALITNSNLFGKYQNKNLNKSITFEKITQDFLQDQTIDENYDYLIEIVQKQDNVNQKALVVYRNNYKTIDNICYYMIYDFFENKIIAKQNSNFYITNINNEFYLAGIIKIL